MQKLDDKILYLEQKKVTDLAEIKLQLHLIAEDIQPSNLLKSFISNIVDSSELKNITISLLAGYLIEKFFVKNLLKVSTFLL